MSNHFDVVRDKWADYMEIHMLTLENDVYRVDLTYASGNNYHKDSANRELNLERTFALVSLKGPGVLPFDLLYGEPYLRLDLIVHHKDIPEYIVRIKQTEDQLKEFKKSFEELFPPDRCLPINLNKETEG